MRQFEGRQQWRKTPEVRAKACPRTSRRLVVHGSPALRSVVPQCGHRRCSTLKRHRHIPSHRRRPVEPEVRPVRRGRLDRAVPRVLREQQVRRARPDQPDRRGLEGFRVISVRRVLQVIRARRVQRVTLVRPVRRVRRVRRVIPDRRVQRVRPDRRVISVRQGLRVIRV